MLYPGLHYVDFGAFVQKPPFVTGLGPIWISWLFVPALALVSVALLFLILRNFVLRGKDPFYRVLWVSAGCYEAFSLFMHILIAIFIAIRKLSLCDTLMHCCFTAQQWVPNALEIGSEHCQQQCLRIWLQRFAAFTRCVFSSDSCLY